MPSRRTGARQMVLVERIRSGSIDRKIRMRSARVAASRAARVKNASRPRSNCLFVLALAAAVGAIRVRADEARQAIELRETMRGGAVTRVQIELKAQGLYRPGLPLG